MAFISASEISGFMFCERAWWLEKRNYFGQLSLPEVVLSAERFETGTHHHNAYSSAVRSASSYRKKGRKLIVAAVLLLLAGIILFLVSQAHASPTKKQPRAGTHAAKAGEERSTISSVQSGIIISAAALILLVVAFALRRSARRKERHWQIPGGSVVSLDTTTLSCSVLELAGRPDAIRREGTYFVPEERKSSKLSPGRAPFHGHVLQLMAYCYLVHKNMGPVPRGLLTYSNGQQHEVPFTGQSVQELTQVLQRMKTLQSAQKVHRSHQSRARCAECKARSMCFESLA